MSLTLDPALATFLGTLAERTGTPLDTITETITSLTTTFTPTLTELLQTRDSLQSQIDAYHSPAPPGTPNPLPYTEFLAEIGYLLPPPNAPFQITTPQMDPEMSTLPGPQLVGPNNRARYALNAANARHVSLYDSLYGTNVIPAPPAQQGGLDTARAKAVIDYTMEYLDQVVPLTKGEHKDVTSYAVADNKCVATRPDGVTDLPSFVGYTGPADSPTAILVEHNGLHIHLSIDNTSPIGALSSAGIADVVVESATTAIMDLEDSVAAVDAKDKVECYANWMGLMGGDLEFTFKKGGKSVTRTLNEDREYTRGDGSSLTVPGRAVMLVRNVGHHMVTQAATVDGKGIGEGFLDLVVTVVAAQLDLKKEEGEKIRNSRWKSVYIVKPKQHGPAEVELTCSMFAHVEACLSLLPNTIKLGIMDEERRTSVNLSACIFAARSRVCFINTGFLDRTGDEVRTSSCAGPVRSKATMRKAKWLGAYERNNVANGLAAGMAGRAQVGKGMWAAPDDMKAMVETKGAQLVTGANTAWVPSPTAAGLHSMHYHLNDVNAAVAAAVAAPPDAATILKDLLTYPVVEKSELTPEVVTLELRASCQSILGYVVRWIDQGVGCSKVPDLNDVGLMEDRATLRISCTVLQNWLHHRVISRSDVVAKMQEMAAIVDRQNAEDGKYVAMAPGFDGLAFECAQALVFEHESMSNGYTEVVLHRFRGMAKAKKAGE